MRHEVARSAEVDRLKLSFSTIDKGCPAIGLGEQSPGASRQPFRFLPPTRTSRPARWHQGHRGSTRFGFLFPTACSDWQWKPLELLQGMAEPKLPAAGHLRFLS